MLPCEIVGKTILPAIKASLTKQLIEKYGMKQKEVAELLGISQSAVSKYLAHKRGRIIKINTEDHIKQIFSEIITMLITEKKKKTDIKSKFCQTCRIIRSKAVICEFCEKTDPDINADICGLCMK